MGTEMKGSKKAMPQEGVGLQQQAKQPTRRRRPVQRQAEWVVLLHGLFSSSKSMSKLETRLRETGYQVCNWQYPTFRQSTDDLVRRLLPVLWEMQSDPAVRTIHFVTHSMGGILARSALHLSELTKVQRVVMLAPPNGGSHLTRLSLGPLTWCVPSIAELSETPDSLPHRLTAAGHVEFGVIAASRDFIVRVANTVLPSQRDHCTVSATHFRLPTNELAVSRVVQFLKSGRFGSELAT